MRCQYLYDAIHVESDLLELVAFHALQPVLFLIFLGHRPVCYFSLHGLRRNERNILRDAKKGLWRMNSTGWLAEHHCTTWRVGLPMTTQEVVVRVDP